MHSAIVCGGTVTDCIEKYTREETVPDYECEHCKGPRNATKHLRIKEPPPVLVIHLKRSTTTDGRPSKDKDPVFVQERITLAPYATDDAVKKSGGCSYALQAMVQHIGDHLHSGRQHPTYPPPGALTVDPPTPP